MIVAELRTATSNGTLPPGTALPTVQQLATTYHVASSTAHRAITLLAHEHLIIGCPWWARRHGATYTRRNPDLVRRLNLPDLRDAKPYADDVLSGELDGRRSTSSTAIQRRQEDRLRPHRARTAAPHRENVEQHRKELLKDERLRT